MLYQNSQNAIKAVIVKRRAHQPTHGWTQSGSPIAPILPTMEQLVYEIYDTQREIIGGITPKRYICRVPVPVKFIERVYSVNPENVRFDGMRHEDAVNYYWEQAQAVGVRNGLSIPFIFAKEITVTALAFGGGLAYKFVNEDGFRWMTIATQQEFFWMSSKRQILNNLSFKLNMKYNCNMHIAYDEAQRIYEQTGTMISHNRHLYTRACDYYLNPNHMDIVTFTRCQIKELRNESPAKIMDMYQNLTKVGETNARLAFEMQIALSIHNGDEQQFVGFFEDEPITGL